MRTEAGEEEQQSQQNRKKEKRTKREEMEKGDGDDASHRLIYFEPSVPSFVSFLHFNRLRTPSFLPPSLQYCTSPGFGIHAEKTAI